eukprot:30918-Pelagococcus_subviridis.AAC.50
MDEERKGRTREADVVVASRGRARLTRRQRSSRDAPLSATQALNSPWRAGHAAVSPRAVNFCLLSAPPAVTKACFGVASTPQA